VRVRFRKLQPGDRLQIGTQVVLRFAFLDDNESRLQRQLYESAVRDALTGAYNRKYFEDRPAPRSLTRSGTAAICR